MEVRKLKLFLIEDHELVRKGVKSILDQDEYLEVIAEYDRPIKAISDLERGILPDIIVMDISMPEMNGLEAADIITDKYPDVKIIILTMHHEEEYVMQALDFNVSGYVVKDSVADEILLAIDKVADGGKFFSKSVINAALDSYKAIKKEKKKQDEIQLTKREKEILANIANGLKSQEIAEKLFISERTVEAHRGNIMKKLKSKNVAELIKKAVLAGIVK